MYSFFPKFQLAHRPYINQLQDILLPYNVSIRQWGLVRYLFESGPSTFGDIATYWQLEKPSITPPAQKLIEQGMIYIQPGVDKRQKVMHLSQQGIELYEQIKQVMDEFQEELLEDITQEEREVAEQLLEKLIANLRKRG